MSDHHHALAKMRVNGSHPQRIRSIYAQQILAAPITALDYSAVKTHLELQHPTDPPATNASWMHHWRRANAELFARTYDIHHSTTEVRPRTGTKLNTSRNYKLYLIHGYISVSTQAPSPACQTQRRFRRGRRQHQRQRSPAVYPPV